MIGRLSAFSTTRAQPADDGAVARGDKDQRLFGAVGQFLDAHRLTPTPPNYSIAYAVVTGCDAAIVRAVALATDGNLRLSQAGADAILAATGSGTAVGEASSAAASVGDLVRAIDDARARFEQYAGIVDSSRQDAQAYGDALADGAATLAPASSTANSGAETVAALLALTQSMIGKTRRAEEQLRAASAEMDDLRANLAAARQDAETDPLTGLPNRRAFEACYAECAAAVPPRPTALALCDIDLFKGVNDRYGHDVGDRVIRLVARELAQGCEDSVVARYGGEEFVILLEGRDLDEAALILDRTRAALCRRSFRVAGTGESLDALSFSGGIIAIRPDEDCRDAVRRADEALYRAKQNGRNRIERG